MSTTSRVDIAVLCHNAGTLNSLVEPAKKIALAINRFRRWQSPVLCVAALTFSSALCILLPSVYFLLVHLAVIGCLAGLGVAHQKGNLLLKVIPRTITVDNQSQYVADLPESLTHTEIMKQYKQIIYYTDRTILQVSKLMEKLYGIIKWSDINHSLRFYSISTFLVIMLHTLPLRWTVTLCFNAFVLYHPLKTFVTHNYFTVDVEPASCSSVCKSPPESDFISVTQSFAPSDEEEIEDDYFSENSTSDNFEVEEEPENLTDTYQKSSLLDERNLSGNEPCINAMDDVDFDFEVPTEVDFPTKDMIKKTERLQLKSEVKGGSEGNDSTGSDTGSIESHRVAGGSNTSSKSSGMVSRLIEFKRKQQQANTGTCVGCGVNFTTILKRKRICTNCGNSFCNKCCSCKIPKLLLGVTAPGSTTELVTVCQECHTYLKGNEKELLDLKI